ncbi:hypothetical protein F441_03113, partial [Phytophthora nicotianae CJ01A1]
NAELLKLFSGGFDFDNDSQTDWIVGARRDDWLNTTEGDSRTLDP